MTTPSHSCRNKGAFVKQGHAYPDGFTADDWNDGTVCRRDLRHLFVARDPCVMTSSIMVVILKGPDTVSRKHLHVHPQ